MKGAGRPRAPITAIMSSVTRPPVAVPLLSDYAASKAGVKGIIKSAALEYARLGITVNSAEMGFVRTHPIDVSLT
ncbi:SDR family NAD(P)-dependent oxidoreductase [Trinickia mobilis]|uniref:SDR family NAD(P)-dependent oxidoreductase n=1 Tax=Trinickia mobilis TaxID=2816356 RepID=UPI0035AB8645